MDTGVSARRIECALNEREIDPRSIQAVFITHEHTDHVSGLRVLAKRYGYKVYASRRHARRVGGSTGSGDREQLRSNLPRMAWRRRGCISSPSTPPMTAGKVSATAYIRRDGRTLAVATDTGCMTDAIRGALVGCDLVLLESNHDIRMLENRWYPLCAQAPYSWRTRPSEQRLLRGGAALSGTKRHHPFCAWPPEPGEQFPRSRLPHLPRRARSNGTLRRERLPAHRRPRSADAPVMVL